jgi:hypothetical protein
MDISEQRTSKLGRFFSALTQFFINQYNVIVNSYILKYFFVGLLNDVLIVFREKGSQTLMDARGGHVNTNELSPAALQEYNRNKRAQKFLGKAKFLVSIPTQALIPVIQWRILAYPGVNKYLIFTVLTRVTTVASLFIYGGLHLFGQYLHGRGGNILSRVTGLERYRVGATGNGFQHWHILRIVLSQTLDYLGGATPTIEYVQKKYDWKMYQQLFSNTKALTPFLAQVFFPREYVLPIFAVSQIFQGLSSFLFGLYHLHHHQIEERKIKTFQNPEIIINTLTMSKWLFISFHKGILSKFRFLLLVFLEQNSKVLGGNISDIQPFARALETHIGNLGKYSMTDKMLGKTDTSQDIFTLFFKPPFYGIIVRVLLPRLGTIFQTDSLVLNKLTTIFTTEIPWGVWFCSLRFTVHSVISMLSINMDIFLYRGKNNIFNHIFVTLQACIPYFALMFFGSSYFLATGASKILIPMASFFIFWTFRFFFFYLPQNKNTIEIFTRPAEINADTHTK